MESLTRALRIAAESDWSFLKDLLLDFAKDDEPAVRFASARAIANAQSETAERVRSELALDDHPLVRAAVQVMSAGRGGLLLDCRDFETAEKMSATLREARKLGKSEFQMQFDRKTGTFSNFSAK